MTCERVLRLVAVASVVFALSNALWSAWRQGWTYDEPFHLEWTERLLVERNAGRESPHYNAKTPILLPNVLLNRAAARSAASQPALRFVSRVPTLLWLALLLLTVQLVGRRLFGPTAGELATIAAALDPNLLAHGSLVTVDVVYALGTLLTIAAAAAFAERPTPARAAALGLALGLALTAKFSAILLLPTLFLVPLLARPARRDWLRWLLGALLAAAVAALVVCCAYLFLDVATQLGSHHWLSRPMRRLARALPWLRLPLPDAFITGYDVSLAAERGDWNVVILSRWYPHGVWFYFAVLWLLLATLLVHLAYFSFFFRTQVGYRFVLMCVPIACLLAGAGLASAIGRTAGERTPQAGGGATGRRRLVALAGVATLALALFENALYVGNPLSFTNAAVWPKKQAFRLIADSNIDWGQHDAEMEIWRRGPGAWTHFNPLHLLPGRDTFSVNEIAGVADFDRHRFLRDHADPGGHIGHTHLWFEVDDALFDRFLDAERRLETRAEDERACPGDAADEPLSPEAAAAVFLAGVPRTNRTWLFCVRAPGGLDLGLRSRHGRLVLARYWPGRPCEGETIDAGQESWHRLLPGTHALCAALVPGPDPAEPPVFEGALLARGGSARLSRRVVDAPAGPR